LSLPKQLKAYEVSARRNATEVDQKAIDYLKNLKPDTVRKWIIDIRGRL
jgi:hypothetical protein